MKYNDDLDVYNVTYVIIRSRMSPIMDLIGTELSELSALELVNLLFLDSVYTITFANIDQSVPNLAGPARVAQW